MTAWEALTQHVSDLQTLEGVMGLLGWDQQTGMPPKAAAGRGAQSALLSTLHHQRLTDPRVGEWLSELESGELSTVQAAAVRNLRREYDRAVKIPEALVGRMARSQAAAFEAWIAAKGAGDFDAFAPHLEELVALTREQASAIDDSAATYDVLLEAFDPGTTAASLEPMFARLGAGLAELLGEIRERPQVAALQGTVPRAHQHALHDRVIAAMGYDLQAGRMDEAEHPFTVNTGAGDVRITTHFYEDDLLSGLGGTIHEAGHALYEQGLPAAHAGTRVMAPASYGLHESQSRFWENTIGRSHAFCEWLAPIVRETCPGTSWSADELYAASNRVEPGLIRVAADEVTYNLHIVVRFQLELALFSGQLQVCDLPGAWNDAYARLLGVTVPDHGVGVLQDVHWSSAAFGYFPSYTLGNLYAASLGVAMQRDLPKLWDDVREGEFSGVLSWLRARIHQRGHIADAPELVRDACGEQRDHVDDLLTYLRGRHGALYGV